MNGLSYAEQGSTDRPFPEPMTGGWPEGYRVAVGAHPLEAGDPAAAFEALAEGILSWRLHRGAGLRVDTVAPRAVPGAEVSTALGVGPFRLPAPSTVLWSREVLREGSGRPVPGQRAGFGYGTRRGHPVRGEEGFYAELTPDGKLVFRVSAYSVPASAIYRFGAPALRLVQRHVTARYVQAARLLAGRN
ncbi:DUF1990 family protein [Arthrobacter zhaoguopingii]|uniref:DUF1990 family protein n=1 Tax=Arthrobacter zhaoguopingii TaxID=2681491 RepID=UPI0013572E81|nr:DUF1990 domain-containing protein [Arthrobacter zhaoguopingii]